MPRALFINLVVNDSSFITLIFSKPSIESSYFSIKFLIITLPFAILEKIILTLLNPSISGFLVNSSINFNLLIFLRDFSSISFPKIIDEAISDLDHFMDEMIEKRRAFYFVNRGLKQFSGESARTLDIENAYFDKYLKIFRKMSDTDTQSYRDYYDALIEKSHEPYVHKGDRPFPHLNISKYEKELDETNCKLEWLDTLSEQHKKKQSKIKDIDDFLESIKIIPTSILEHKKIVDIQ